MIFKKCILSVLLLATSVTIYAIPPLGTTTINPTTNVVDAAIIHRVITAQAPLNFIGKIQFACTLVATVNILYQLASVAKKYLFPGQEEELNFLLQKKAIQIFIAKDSFNDSLIDHITEQKNAGGIPLACKDDAIVYARAAGIEELNKAVQEFKTAYGQLV